MKIIKPLLFSLLGILLFFCVQEIFTVKWRYPYWNNPHSDRMAEYYELCEDEDTNIQAVFLGTSISEYGVSPMRIYEQTGIATYNLSFDAQNMELSYYMLKDVFHRIQPKYVLLEAGGLLESNFSDGREKVDGFNNAPYRYILDDMRFGENKIALARAYAAHWDEAGQNGAFLSALFPIYEYHSRWNELKDLDFSPFQRRNLYTKGEYIRNDIQTGTTVELMNDIAQRDHSNLGRATVIRDGIVTEEVVGRPAYDPAPNESRLDYLLKMRDLCRENGAQLILVKIPAAYLVRVLLDQDYSMPYLDGLKWSEICSEKVKQISAEYDVPYFDLMYDYDLQMDWETDSIDGGIHLNYLGAKKVSDFLSDYLRLDCALEPEPSRAYDGDIEVFDKVTALAELQLTQHLTDYLPQLAELNDVTVFLSANDDMASRLSDGVIGQLRAIGFESAFEEMEYADSFIAVKEDDAIPYEAISDRYISYSGALADGTEYMLSSCGWLLGSTSEIQISGTEYSMKGRGLNIVIYDNERSAVIDSVSFDLYSSDDPISYRNAWNTEIYLREYEQDLMGIRAEQAGVAA